MSDTQEKTSKEADDLYLKLGLENTAGYQSVQKTFIGRIAALMRPGTLKDEEAVEEIRELFKLYSMYNSVHIKNLGASSKQKTKDYPDADTVKRNAGSIIYGLHTTLGAYCIAMLKINKIKAQIEKNIESAKARASEEQEEIQLSPDLPVQIAISVRRRDSLRKTLSQMEYAEKIVFLLDTVLNFMNFTLNDVLGEETSKVFFEEYTGKLRAGKISAANEFFKSKAQIEKNKFFMLKKKEKRNKWNLLIEIAELIEQFINKCRKIISSGNRQQIFLRKKELNSARRDIQAQLQKYQNFISKYELPEVRYRYEALERQRKILKDLGPFEELLQMIEQVEMASVSPMPTMKDVKTFEEGLYKQAMCFLEQDNIEIENILKLAQELAQGPDPDALTEDEIASAEIED